MKSEKEIINMLTRYTELQKECEPGLFFAYTVGWTTALTWILSDSKKEEIEK